MFIAWLAFLRFKNPGIVDFFWSLVIFETASNYFIFSSKNLTTLGLWCFLLLFLCAFRLSLSLLFNRILKAHKENRYYELSQAWHKPLSFACLLQFLFQGVLAFLISLPFSVLFLLKSQIGLIEIICLSLMARSGL